MKRNILLYSLALASIVASCAKTDMPHFGGANDPNAVTISPSVALVSTRSNPLGDETAQEKFNPGDVITITDNSDRQVYNYALGTDGKWKPTDGKYLLWHDETLNISASYGESDIKNVKDQSTAAGIAAADYMTFIGRVTREPGSNKLSFNMDRRRYLVIVIIDSYGDQYHQDDKVSGLKLSFEESGSSVEINPYVRDVAGNNVTTEGNAGTEGTLGYSYSAICDVEYKTIKISYQVAGDKREAILSGFGGPDPGYSYTIKLRVGKDKIEVGDVTVGDWTDYAWEDDVTATKIPYLTFSADSEQKFSMNIGQYVSLEQNNAYFEYSVGGINWTKFTETVENIAFGGGQGDLYLRGKSSKGTASDRYAIETYCSKISFGNAVPVTCTGDIRTLIDYTTYSTVGTGDARFTYLFQNCNQLTTAPDLPSASLADYCYYELFSGCTSLTDAPVLPAETLAEACYQRMFYDCTSLTDAPVLNAETLADYCYSEMFCGCSALTTAPDLPADKLAENCYEYMFYKCKSLKTAPALNATNLANYCYSYMFHSCTSLTEAPELDATKLANYCYQGMFKGCSALSSVTMLATDVSATSCLMYWLDDGAGTSASTRTLTVANDNVYTTMVSKGYVPELWKKAEIKASDGSTIGAEAEGNIPYVTFSAASEQEFKMAFFYFTLGEGEYFEYSVGGSKWVRFTNTVKDIAFGGDKGDLRLRGKSSKGTASEINNYSYISFSNADVSVECTGDIRTLIDYTAYSSDDTGSAKFLKLFNGCTQLTSAPALPAETLADNCYQYMFDGCTALTSAPALPAKTLANNCYKHMFDGCTALTSAPALPAEILANNCYSYMFQGCTSLTTVPQELPATTLKECCYEAMFNGCTSLKTAPVLKATTLANSCYLCMFQGCTNLSSVTMLATNVSASICLYNWLNNAGTSASTRTLTLASEAAYTAIESTLPDNWKSGQATINYQNN